MIKIEIKDSEVFEVVTKAFARSLTRAQVSQSEQSATILVSDRYEANHFGKVIIFGAYPEELQAHEKKIGICDEQKIHYAPHVLTQNFHLKERAFERYDFEREWNNLGYGRIESNSETMWGVADTKRLSDEDSFVSVFDTATQSVLWINRPVGLVDGFDWRLIEDFVSDYRHLELPTLPVLSEIPEGYRGAATMRIDCDEAILSGKPLFELYQKYNFPFSLAIKTEQEFSTETLKFINQVIETGGSVLSHSHTHAPEWGEPSTKAGPKSRGDAFFEASTSLQVLKEKLPNYAVYYAVSPFHQNPPAALPKIKEAGIDGFIAGIICNDPEYLMARGGETPFVDGMVSHSEQCMFHGDCYHDADNSIDTYIDAFKSALKTDMFFGFLDHPFSTYQYGWNTEEERITAHEAFLKVLTSEPLLWLASTKQTLDFIWDRTHSALSLENGTLQFTPPAERRSVKEFKCRYQGKSQAL